MLTRRLFSLLLALLSGLLIACFVGSINCSAALTGGKYLTPAESLQVFGSSINFSFFNGTDYTDAVFTYDTTATVTGYYGDVPSFYDDISGTATYLKYTASVTGLSTNVNYITVDVRPSYSLFDTEQLTTCIALSNNGVYISNTYQSPSWDWYISGNVQHFENSLTYNTNYHSMLAFSRVRASYVPLQFISQSSFSGYSQRAVFCGNSPDSGVLNLFIMCPYVSVSAEGSNGTFTQTSSGGGGDINVDVNIDMSETNSLLEDIKNGLSGIWSGITGVFVPESSFVQQWRLDMADTLGNSFGKYTELDSTLSRVQSAFIQTSGSATVSFPGVSPPGIGQIIPASQVSAVPESLQSFLPHIKFAFNILATMLFVNGMKRKWDEIIHGKIVTETESGVL